MDDPQPLNVTELEQRFKTETREADCIHTKSPKCQGRYVQHKLLTKPSWDPAICPACMEMLDAAVSDTELKMDADRRMSILRVPPLYHEVCLDSWVPHGEKLERDIQTNVIYHAGQYLESWPHVPMVVVMRGGPGTGKGHISWTIAKEVVVEHGADTAVIKLPDLIRELRESWGRPDQPSETEVLAKYREFELLIIDEVSRHAFYGEPHRHLYDLIDYRLEWQRPTIITTNETLDELEEILTPAVTDRVGGQNAIWEFGKESFRGKEMRHE